MSYLLKCTGEEREAQALTTSLTSVSKHVDDVCGIGLRNDLSDMCCSVQPTGSQTTWVVDSSTDLRTTDSSERVPAHAGSAQRSINDNSVQDRSPLIRLLGILLYPHAMSSGN